MKIYEITFLLVTYLSLGANSWLRAVLHRFSLLNPLRVVGAKKTRQQMEVPGEFWCDLFIIHLSRLKTYVSVSMIIYISIFLAIYLPTYSIHQSKHQSFDI